MPQCTRWGLPPCWTALRYTMLVTLGTGTACGPAGEWWHGVSVSVSASVAFGVDRWDAIIASTDCHCSASLPLPLLCSPTAPADRKRCTCNPLDNIHVGAQPRCTVDFYKRLAALERRDGDATTSL